MGDPETPDPRKPVRPEPYDVGPPEELREPARPKGRLDEPGLLEDFDEDADFSVDPEVDAAILAGAEARPAEPAPKRSEPPRTGPPLVQAGKTPDRVWLAIAGVLLLVAITETLIWAPGARPARVGLTIYGAIVNTGLGLAAIYLAGRLLERPLGAFERAGARVALAACLAQVGTQLQLTLIGTVDNRIEELAIAAAAYALALWALFRWDARTLGVVLGLHFLGWLAIQTGASLQSCAAAAGSG
ncbi:MAG: hypothetical protein ACF8R7_08170 [Phycisphaerales bacterium JB039]